MMKKKQTLVLSIGTSLFLLLGIVGLKYHNRIYAWTLGDVKSLYVYNMATFYIEGHGFQKDLAKGAEYLTQAAQQGLPAALFNLGRMYQLGKGVPQDNQEAKRLFRQASAQGHQLATDFLIKMETQDSTSVNDTIFEMKMLAR